MAQQEVFVLKGYVLEKDTLTPIPFAYVVNKKIGTGTVCNDKGYFEIKAMPNDSIIFTSLGYVNIKCSVSDLLKLPSWQSKHAIMLFPKTYNLQPIVIQPRSLSKNEKNFYERAINVPEPSIMSPISALYYHFSREGKEREKLALIYRKELFYEHAEKRLDAFLMKKKVDLSNFDKRGFIAYCGFDEEFIDEANDYEFYYKVSRCFDAYKGTPDYR